MDVMKSSLFLRYAAHCIEDGFPVDRAIAPAGWVQWIVHTLPTPDALWNDEDVTETRVMRFLLAAEMAEDAGD